MPHHREEFTMPKCLARGCLSIAALILLAGLARCGSATDVAPATGGQPKFCNLIFTDMSSESIIGLHRFVDATKSRGLWGRFRMTILLLGDERERLPKEQTFFRGLAQEGHEIGLVLSDRRTAIAQWLSIPKAKITTVGAQMFADLDMEAQARDTAAGFRAQAHACVEGNSLREFWDIPHNWEGAPMFPYWVQWDAKNPRDTARVNREMDKDRAMLELQWASRTLWHNYDRFPIPQCWHFGEPLKTQQWSMGPLVRRGEKGGWWRVELEEYEKNLRAGRTPFLYLNTASEGDVFVPKGPWAGFLNPDEALDCAVDLVELMVARGWTLNTVSQFTDWFAQRWPCPAAPSMVYVMNDTLANRRDRDGQVIQGHGRLLHAETKHFQICDHENRIAPEMVIAYDLRTPNLCRGGYTYANPEKYSAPESKEGHTASTTGNALFWSPSEPLKSAAGYYYFPPYKDPQCRNRTFTFYLGDRWEPYQFAAGNFYDVRREGDKIRWTKEMDAPIPGSDILVRYHHTLDGPEHTIRIEVEGAQAVGLPVRFRVCPYFHQGWDYGAEKRTKTDPRMPDPAKIGQQQNVFARAGNEEFAFSSSHDKPITKTVKLTRSDATTPLQLLLYNRNPGQPGGRYDDNPAFNRGFTLTIDQPEATVQFVDQPGPTQYVTAVVELGPHQAGHSYTFHFRYWHGDPPER
jgi:hypothetical protein